MPRQLSKNVFCWTKLTKTDGLACKNNFIVVFLYHAQNIKEKKKSNEDFCINLRRATKNNEHLTRMSETIRADENGENETKEIFT